MPEHLVGVPRSGSGKPPFAGEAKLASATAVPCRECGFVVTVSLDFRSIFHLLNPQQPHRGLQSRFQAIWQYEPGNHGLGAPQGQTRFHAERIPH